MKIAVTGHRPPRLGLDYSRAHRDLLEEFALFYLSAFILTNCEEVGHDCLRNAEIYNGGAQGWDQAVMAAAHKSFAYSVVAAIPFHGHESRWPAEAQEYYRKLLEKCSEVKYFGGRYSNKLFAVRDRWMVDQADVVLALYDGNPDGGTALTVQYAEKKGVKVVNFWDDWVDFKKRNFEAFCDNNENRP